MLVVFGFDVLDDMFIGLGFPLENIFSTFSFRLPVLSFDLDLSTAELGAEFRSNEPFLHLAYGDDFDTMLEALLVALVRVFVNLVIKFFGAHFVTFGVTLLIVTLVFVDFVFSFVSAFVVLVATFLDLLETVAGLRGGGDGHEEGGEED